MSSTLHFRYIAIEGPIGVGKSLLADRLGARLDATVVLDETENPFLADFYADRPARVPGAALLHADAPPPADGAAAERPLQPADVCDYLFDRDKIYAYLNLDDNELFIYQRLYELLAQDVPAPDLVDLPADADRRAAQAPPRARARESGAACRSTTTTCAS